jgi:tight adherence protein C
MRWLLNVSLSLKLKFIDLYGERDGFSHYSKWLRTMMRLVFIILMISITTSVICRNYEFICLGLLIAIITQILMVQKLNEKLKQKRLMILAELPDWLNRMIIRLCAGDSLRFAIENSIVEMHDTHENPLRVALHQLVMQLRNNQSLNTGLELLNRRTKVMEVSKVVTILLLHTQRGGDDLVQVLRDVNQSLWLLKKTLVRTRGEEASTRALFPMLIIFLVMLIIIAFPAVQSF